MHTAQRISASAAEGLRNQTQVDTILQDYNQTQLSKIQVTKQADLLILLSDIDGLLTGDPHVDRNAKVIHIVEEITDEIEALAGGSRSSQGTGGMITKIHAAKLAASHGIDMVISHGAKPQLLYDIVEGKPVGTRFIGKKL